MMVLPASPEPQPCLFGGLPSTEPRRRRPRAVVATEPSGPAAVASALPCPPPLPLRPPPVSLRIDAAALGRPELCDLVRDLGEANLGVLLVEAAREARRRLQPDDADESGVPTEPSPQLLRAVRCAVSELAEGED